MSGGSQPTGQTVTQTNIPEYLRPQVEEMVGMASGLMHGELARGYQPYEGQRIAGFTPMQAQAFQQVAGQQVAPQLTDASNVALGAGQAALGYGQQASGIGQAGMAAAQQAAQQAAAGAGQYGAQGAGYGAQAAGMAPSALGYGAAAAGLGMQGVGLTGSAQQVAERQADIYGQLGSAAGLRGETIGGRGVSAAEQGFGAGQAYQQMATSPQAMQAYMSPYMQNVVDVQQREAVRQADIQRQANQAQAVAQGAYGGSRQGVVEAELQRNLGTKLAEIQALGQQRAFEQAQQAQQFGAGLGIQGLQAGLQGLQTGMQGTGQAITGAGLGLQGTGQRLAAGQLGLQGIQTGISGQQAGTQAVGQAGQLYGLGIQGAQAGLTGVGQQIAAGQLAQQGVQNALQGQNLGIAGSQAATGAAGQLGALGGQQFQQQMAITDAMQKYGALQQAQQQQGLDVDYQNYLAAQNFPYQQLGAFSDLIRGFPMSQSTQTIYGGQPSLSAQLPGILMAGYGAYKSKEGGRVPKYAVGGKVAAEAMTLEDARSLPAKLRRLSDTQLAAYARTVKDAVALSTIQTELQRRAQSRTPYNPGAAEQSTLADQIAKRAEAASVGMAGGGIVALSNGGSATSPWLNEEIIAPPERPQSGPVARYLEAIGVTRPPFEAVPVPEAPPGPTLPPTVVTGEVPKEKPLIEAPARGPAQAGPGMQRFSTFDQFKAMLPKGEIDPAQQAILNDMQARISKKMESAEGERDRSKYEAIMMAGLAMMGGNSFADGLARAAQTGGATYMASKKEARKAIDDAEKADLAFRQYQLEVMKGNEKAAQEQFGTFLNYTAKMADVDAKYAAIGASGAKGTAFGPDKYANTLRSIEDTVNKRFASRAESIALLPANQKEGAMRQLEKDMATARRNLMQQVGLTPQQEAAKPSATGKTTVMGQEINYTVE